MYRLVLISTLIAILAGCASAPKNYQSYDATEDRLKISMQNSELANIAALTLFQANENLNKAKTELDGNNTNEADHFIYLANKKIDLAEELYKKELLAIENEKLENQYQELIAHSRRIEAKRTQEEHSKASNKIKELELMLGQYKAEETSRGTLLVINDLLFDSGGFKLTSQSQVRLQPLVMYLLKNIHRGIIIEGHTDSIGDAELNKNLSLQRSNTVKEYLVSKGIENSRIETRGFGEEVPVSSNATNAGRNLNRRVEVIIKNQNKAINLPQQH